MTLLMFFVILACIVNALRGNIITAIILAICATRI